MTIHDEIAFIPKSHLLLNQVDAVATGVVRHPYQVQSGLILSPYAVTRVFLGGLGELS